MYLLINWQKTRCISLLSRLLREDCCSCFFKCINILNISFFAGLLHTIFENLYDGDILTEEAFDLWENCTDPAEQEGKGVAVKSTTQFFTWLREAEEEEKDEDE